MTFRPLDLASLPRASSGSALPTIEFARTHAALVGRTGDLRTSPFGAGRLTCSEITVPRPPDQADLVWALTRETDEEVGYLLVEGMTALRIVAATLGIPAPRILRPMGTAERGIVTAAVATAARNLGSDLAVHLGRRVWNGQGLVRVIVTAEFQRFREPVRIDVPPAWLSSLGLIASTGERWLLEAVPDGFEFPFALELARTTLSAGDWAHAAAGDVVVFDDQPPWDGLADRRLSLVCGGYFSTVMITPRRSTKMVTEFQSRGGPSSRAADAFTQNENGDPMSTESPDIDIAMDVALSMLASAPIEVVAEIGRVMMRADEVTALRPGAVLPLGPISPTTVSLKVGDRAWAEGQLVEVNGQLGVRLTAIVSTPRSLAAAVSSDEADTLR